MENVWLLMSVTVVPITNKRRKRFLACLPLLPAVPVVAIAAALVLVVVRVAALVAVAVVVAVPVAASKFRSFDRIKRKVGIANPNLVVQSKRE